MVEIYKCHTSMILVARGVLDPTKIQSLTERGKDACTRYGATSVAELQCVASLASCGLLGARKWLVLNDVDLTQVPEEKLISLVSSVTLQLSIGQNVTGWVSLLPHLRCQYLDIRHQSLGREETQALVRAMEVGVEKVVLYSGVTLDMASLLEYSGEGVCHKVDLSLSDIHRSHYQEAIVRNVRTWANRRNWGASITGDNWIFLTKK